ncbi:MAG: hypothetical protein HKP48_07855 [Winogradskyella sp.]|uniref:DUF6327 family protein n=1 Tax=Winogradskyella sp. TaxID=1883156 RepID=UPI0017900C57|nr:DUF6327 family protein [Winogradskyella sp.]MBT8245736.1 hypothetical protein [Winogradskyella sp.]NNK23195.1 hypothetical protein [Winogradskyella sp.]
MKPHIYNSFEEIDEHLKIMKLKRDIDKEYLKIHLISSKNSLYPINMLQEIRAMLLKYLSVFMKRAC